jgi:hypothetical protein
MRGDIEPARRYVVKHIATIATLGRLPPHFQFGSNDFALVVTLAIYPVDPNSSWIDAIRLDISLAIGYRKSAWEDQRWRAQPIDVPIGFIHVDSCLDFPQHFECMIAKAE